MAAGRAAAGETGGDAPARPSQRVTGGSAPVDASSAEAADRQRLAIAVREACRRAAAAAWEEAQIAGLCAEGAWEAAMGAVSRLTPAELLAASTAAPPDTRSADPATDQPAKPADEPR